MAEVLGRESELEALSGFVAEIAAGPASFLLEGEPGIGKTTLWRAAVAAARERSYCVLDCRPVGSEVQLSFAALGDLLGELHEATLTELPAPQRRALEVALLREESEGPPPDQRAIALATLGVLRVLARSRPVLVAVDDSQWLDRPTAAVLEFALRRLDDEPIALLFATRIEAGRAGVPDRGRVLLEERQFRLRVGPLSVAALHRLLRSRLGIGLPRPLLLRVHETSGGNPFYALELARALEPMRGRLRPGERLPVPENLQELVRARLEALPKGAQETLLAVALLADPSVPTVEAATARGRARSRLEAAAEAGVVELAGDRITFNHPLLASSVYTDAGAERRRRLHRRLATVVDDPEAQARHLALGVSGRNAKVAAALDRAAGQASARGAPDAAAALLELAVEVTPLAHVADLRRRKLGAAEAHLSSGAIEEGTELLEELLDELPAGDERAAILLRLAGETVDREAALGLLEQARAEVVSDQGVRSRIHLMLSLLSIGSPLRDIDHAFRHGRIALRHAEESGERRLVVQALARLSLWELWGGRDVSSLLQRALELQEPNDRLRDYEDPTFLLALWRVYQGRLDEARSLFEALFAEAAALGDEISCLAIRGRLVDVELRAGNWQQAATHAATTYEIAEQIGIDYDGGVSVYWKAIVDAHLGRVADARSAAELGSELSRAAKRENILVMNLGVLGFLELSLGKDAAAFPYLRPLLDWLGGKKLALATHPIAPYALEALVAVGELEEARESVARFEREASVLESRWALEIGSRCRGLLASAEGDLATAVRALESALAYDEHGQWPFEQARTLLVLGRTQRRGKQKAAAKTSFEHALAIFDRLGASLWSDRTREDLERIGLRRAAPGHLTETEKRVAELAASGLTNREVAKQLFVSPKTVEANLARAYRKLGIHSRAELGARLAGVLSERAQT